jgi:cholest-4-en-3-one 26-monooxygenase
MAAPSLDTLDIHSADLYVSRGYPWQEWDLLRREAPIFWYEREGIEPFWAITRRADVLAISKRADIFVNSRRLRLQTIEEDERQFGSMRMRNEALGWDPDEPNDFIFMDDPRHRNFRLISSKSFTPAALRKLEAHFEELSLKFADEFAAQVEAAAEAGETCDFVRGFAEKLPLAAIGEMLGLPPDDWQRLKMLTNVMIGAPEPDFFQPGETRNDATARAYGEMVEYMIKLVHDRRARGPGGDDLAGLIVHAEIDGKPLTVQQLQGYLFVILAAGNETTRNAIAGGVHALLENPDQRELLCSDPNLVVSASEEILRWTSPVVQFARTPIEDFELSGQTIKAGEDVGMWYPSANRDDAVFEDPYRFDITRNPNRHLAFGGYGAHFCLGANLARWELRAALRALIPILPKLESAGPAERVPNLHVPAIHRLLVRAA